MSDKITTEDEGMDALRELLAEGCPTLAAARLVANRMEPDVLLAWAKAGLGMASELEARKMWKGRELEWADALSRFWRDRPEEAMTA